MAIDLNDRFGVPVVEGVDVSIRIGTIIDGNSSLAGSKLYIA